MNMRKVRYSCFVVCLSVLLGSSWTAPAVAETVLKTQRFVLVPANATTSVQFQVPGPGKVILEATALSPLKELGLIARGSDPNAADLRKDGLTPLRLEFAVTAQNLAKGSTWTVFTTTMGTNGVVYKSASIPGIAAVGDLKVSFVPDAPAQKTALQPKAVPNWGAAAQPTSGMATGKSSPAQVTSGMATGGGVPPAEPTWPQPFELGPGEQTGFGFVAGNPGPIVVNVQWTGVPLTVSLAKPGGGSIDQQGNGSVTLQYNATADDVKKGVLWGVSIRPTPVAPKPSGGTGITAIDKPVKIDTKGLAKGTVNVQHPPGDMKLAQAELKARADRLALQAKSQPVATANVNILAQRQEALQKQETVRQAALLEQVKPKIPVQAYQQMSQKIAVGAQPGASKGIIIVDSGSKTTPPGASATTATSGISLARGRGVAMGDKSSAGVSPAKATGTSAQADVSSAGSNTPATIAADPVIASLSVSSGQPGDPVLITGSGFSNDPGEVHFIVASGKDIAAPVTVWSDTQIFAAVPDVSGILTFNGQMYVKRGQARSSLVPFRFIPATEVKRFPLEAGHAHIQRGDGSDTSYAWGGNVGTPRIGANHYSSGPFGHKGDDGILENYRLMNGWVLDSIEFSTDGGWCYVGGGKGGADASIVEAAYGTDGPAIKIHWWNIGFCQGSYSLMVNIRGPRGVPHY